jgi:chemotaxis protein methyltransferase CheR
MDQALSLFFQEVTAALGLRAAGFRNARGSVTKRLSRRLRTLGLSGVDEYRRYLAAHGEEWVWLEQCCQITISRFARDAGMFGPLLARYLPERAKAAQARGDRCVRVWSAGAASGEEPYSVSIAWHLELEPLYPDLRLEVVATDANAVVLERAARARYPVQSLWELPASLRERAFMEEDGEWTVRPALRAGVRFEQADLRRQGAPGPFDLVLCRNLAFTYFGEPTQRRVAQRFTEVLRPSGVLLIGRGEALPTGVPELLPREPGFYERAPLSAASTTGDPSGKDAAEAASVSLARSTVGR